MDFTFSELTTIANVLGNFPRVLTDLDEAVAIKSLWEIMKITDADREHINWTPVVIDGRRQFTYTNISITRALDTEQLELLTGFLNKILSGIKGELIPILVPVMLQMGWEPTQKRIKELLTNQSRALTTEQAVPLLEIYERG